MGKLLAILAAMGLLLGVSVLTASPASASVYEGTVAIDCDNADAAGSGAHTLDRDNTGSGQESLRVEVTDGAGTIIYELTFSNVLGTFAGGVGDFFYTTPPALNPITFTLTSLAGNGLPEQVDYVQVGVCDTIDWAAPEASAPGSATAGESITIDGEGCPAGTVTADLLEEEGSTTVLATGTTEATAFEDPFSIELTIPAGAPVGDAVILVYCGTAADPISEAVVLGLSIVAQPTTTTTIATTTTAPRPAQPVAVTPAFTG
jgi:hypothetical protein